MGQSLTPTVRFQGACGSEKTKPWRGSPSGLFRRPQHAIRSVADSHVADSHVADPHVADPHVADSADAFSLGPQSAPVPRAARDRHRRPSDRCPRRHSVCGRQPGAGLCCVDGPVRLWLHVGQCVRARDPHGAHSSVCVQHRSPWRGIHGDRGDSSRGQTAFEFTSGQASVRPDTIDRSDRRRPQGCVGRDAV